MGAEKVQWVGDRERPWSRAKERAGGGEKGSPVARREPRGSNRVGLTQAKRKEGRVLGGEEGGEGDLGRGPYSWRRRTASTVERYFPLALSNTQSVLDVLGVRLSSERGLMLEKCRP